MTEPVVAAYIPVLHEGYWRFIDRHARGRRLFVIGPSLVPDYRPLAKDVRRLDPGLVAAAVDAWGICSEVFVLDEELAEQLAAERPALILPAEDVSYQVVERWIDAIDEIFHTWFYSADPASDPLLIEDPCPVTL